MRRVVLLTDFGTADGYAAAMAGVVAAAAPGALIEHAAHDIAPGDIFGAALALSRYAALYPADVPFLYFVAEPSGRHVFTRSLEEHNRAKAALRREAGAPSSSSGAR